MNSKDITGMEFGYWTVLYRDKPHPNKRNAFYICHCVCGNVKAVNRSTLVNGRSQSCGCIKYDRSGVNSTHGMSKSRIYHEWVSMRRRCKDTKGKFAENYALKGITVCPEWESDFLAFRDWAYSSGYTDQLTIDRIDNSKGYFPDNCRWIPFEEQQRNKTNNVYVEYNGETWCLRTLCGKLGFPYKTAHRRYIRMKNKGLPIDTEKLVAPIQENKIAKCYRKS